MSWSSGVFSRVEGIYSGATLWVQEAAAAIGIVASRHDTHDQDLADGINATIHKGGQNSPTANINWGGFKITNMASGSSASDSATFTQTEIGAGATGQNSAGTTQGTATAITTNNVFGSSVTLHQGFVLPTPVAGRRITFTNPSGNAPCLLYPSSGTNFNGLPSNLPLTMMSSSSVELRAIGTTTWAWSYSPGVLQTGITALGTTQAAGYQILYSYNIVTTVTGAAEAVTLPHPHPGLIVMIGNVDAGDTLKVFPASGDDASSGINASVSIPITGAISFVGITNTTWVAFGAMSVNT